MAGNSKSSNQIYRLVVMALMAAMVYLGTIIRIPLGNSKVHIANAICVFAGFILNPLDAGIAAGLGSAIYDIMHGYGLECLITFVSKFAMAMVSALLLRLLQKHNAKGSELSGEHTPLIYAISAVSALTYTALYMLKSFLWVVVGLVATEKLEGRSGLGAAGWWMMSKLPASLLNAGVSTVLAPFLYWAVRPVLVRQGIIAKLNPPVQN